MYIWYRKKMNKLMIIPRQLLMKEELPPVSCQMLLYIIDLVNHNFRSLAKNLQEFYELQLGKAFIQSNIISLFNLKTIRM